MNQMLKFKTPHLCPLAHESKIRALIQNRSLDVQELAPKSCEIILLQFAYI